MQASESSIDYLADRPDRLETLAKWHDAEWGAMHPGDTLRKRIVRMQTHLDRMKIPTTFVALADDTLLGSASLVADDMHAELDLTPWLASVYVHPHHRRLGVGRALVLRVVAEARALDVQTLYLFTPDREQFYTYMGWSVPERRQHLGQHVVVMSLLVSRCRS